VFRNTNSRIRPSLKRGSLELKWSGVYFRQFDFPNSNVSYSYEWAPGSAL